MYYIFKKNKQSVIKSAIPSMTAAAELAKQAKTASPQPQKVEKSQEKSNLVLEPVV